MCNNIAKVITKRVLLVIFFFGLTPLVIGTCFIFLYYKPTEKVLSSTISPVSNVNRLYGALPPSGGEINAQIKVEDARCLLIRNYLKKYSSPLLPYYSLICESSLKYGLDYRLLVAIAQQESNLCKNSNPEWHNCWGWGIHSKGILTFSSYDEAIEKVAKGIKENYCDKGFCDDPCLMMKKYTPKSNGSWCFGVKQFMEEIEQGI